MDTFLVKDILHLESVDNVFHIFSDYKKCKKVYKYSEVGDYECDYRTIPISDTVFFINADGIHEAFMDACNIQKNYICNKINESMDDICSFIDGDRITDGVIISIYISYPNIGIAYMERGNRYIQRMSYNIVYSDIPYSTLRFLNNFLISKLKNKLEKFSEVTSDDSSHIFMNKDIEVDVKNDTSDRYVEFKYNDIATRSTLYSHVVNIPRYVLLNLSKTKENYKDRIIKMMKKDNHIRGIIIRNITSEIYVDNIVYSDGTRVNGNINLSQIETIHNFLKKDIIEIHYDVYVYMILKDEIIDSIKIEDERIAILNANKIPKNNTTLEILSKSIPKDDLEAILVLSELNV